MKKFIFCTKFIFNALVILGFIFLVVKLIVR